MKKYVLIYSQERELSVRGAFNTLSEAQMAMQKDFQEYLLSVGMSEEDYYEILEGEGYDDAFIDETSAWSNYDTNMNIDWKIEEVEFDV